LMGRDLYRRGDPTSANRHFDLALQRQPDHFWARCLSAICYLRLGRPLVAKVSLSACIEREQEYAWLYVWRGFASSQLAATAGDQLKQQPSKQNKALREEADHEFEAARADYDQALKLLDSSPDTVLKWVLFQHRGLLWLQRDDWAKAAADLKTAIGLDEHRPEPFAALALVYQRQQKPDAAIEQYRRAIALKPSWAVLYRERAGVDLARKNSTPAQRQRALRDIDQAIQHEGPDNAGLARDYTYRAQLLHADGREDDALAACDAALKVRPDEPNAHQLRIELLLKLERYDDVKRSCDALEARNKSSAAIYELRGLARASSKDHAGAIEDFTRAIALRPERAVLYVRRGVLYLVSDAPKLARHDFAEAIRIDPSDSDALIGRAAARVRLGEHRQAVEDAEKALRLSVPTADRLYIAARIYARASAVASAEIRTRFDDTVTLVARYQDRGTSLLREAMQKRSAGERETFWRDVVQGDPDPAMTALSRRLR